MKRKRILISLALAVFTAGSLWLIQRLVMPKYMGDIVEGALIAEYYNETEPHDVIFVGDCEAMSFS